MRLRNIKGAEEFIAASTYVIQNPEEYKGRWNVFFQNENPIYLEIGMGKGQFIHTLAAQNPDINYIGIEMYSSVLYRAIEKREQSELSNLYFIRMDAGELKNVFDEHEVCQIYLNFSDPWPKARHAKRRLTSPVFLSLYDYILKPDGCICFKTDNRSLFDYSVETISTTAPWNLKDVTYDLHHSPYADGNVMTEYEEKFSSKGMPIHRLVAYR
jgi:tRNA (guanine-N7-)-methyltransferase